jgi:hypothetical protein
MTALRPVEDGYGATAVVDVERGGTVRSFRTADGWELFAQGPDPDRDLAPGDAFVRSGFTGHVECLPTIVACTVPGLPADPLVDHGALWPVPWALVAEGNNGRSGFLRLSVDVVGWPVTLVRSVIVSASRLVLHYELINHGEHAVPVLWAGHGLLAAPPRTRVHMGSGGTAPLWQVGATSAALPAENADRLLREVEGPDGLALDDLGPGGYIKAFAPWPDDGAWLLRDDGKVHVRASHPSGRLRMGLWLNNGGIPASGPLRHVALEPTTGDDDDLSACVRRDTCWWAPGGSRTAWSMSYTVHGI